MIVTNEIERLKKDQPNLRMTALVLRGLLKKHPALDYADELLDCYNRMTIHYHSLVCGDEECAPLCKEAQALLRKIENEISAPTA